ncbi:ribonuclease H-like domain-containing protein [Candidatus Acetothermia bacterium]|nr:ribonuclease H-like domain-containing protein [Candidatus Acetothermia bacterium]MCI2427553.1 ribonuclease H-like domain-containing protein [Candidatus Acetothermia bacterium]MCI2428402.1 ribonuclease H-like domain-containing protein [Candidatus Acetothermia bacterium]
MQIEREIQTKFGACLLIEERLSFSASLLSQADAHDLLYAELRLIFGIGEHHQQRLRREGYRSIRALIDHPRWGKAALALLNELGRELSAKQAHKILSRWLPSSHPLNLVTAGLVDTAEIIFFDIESLGLYNAPIFLVSIARLTTGGLVLKQYLARKIGEEPPLLIMISREITAGTILVTYNGKAFDWKMVQERLTYYGLPLPDELIHLDLLCHARRQWRDELPDLRLSTVERYKLNIKRQDDLPGSLIPALYSRYLDSGFRDLLTPIIDHNRQDIISLVVLLSWFSQQLIDHHLSVPNYGKFPLRCS